MPRQAIVRLMLTNFRTYKAAQIELDARPVVLFGPNGIGKTNVLEAISFLGSGRGLRGATLLEPCHLPQANPWAVAVRLMQNGSETLDIGVGLDPASRAKRVVRINGAPASGPVAVAEHFSLSWLTPAMDRLFAEGATARRRFVDRMVLALNPSHASTVSAYEKAMRERNGLLSDLSKADPAWLTALEGRMAEYGVAMAASRRELVGQLAAHIDRQAESAFPKASVQLEGFAEARLGEDSAAAIETALMETWAAGRARDAAAGRTLDGPHRSDLNVHHAPKAIPADQCSTGEQKALLVGLVLAHARMVESLTGRGPILLLDEVAAHLDSDRRAALFAQLSALDGQSWMTGTDASFFDAFGDSAQLLRIGNGSIAQAAETR